jgi:hypothetical protein
MCAVCAQCASVRPIQPFYLTKWATPYKGNSLSAAWSVVLCMRDHSLIQTQWRILDLILGDFA